MRHSCAASTFTRLQVMSVFACLHLCVPCCARIALCVHSPVLPGGPLKLDSLLSGFSSLQAHLEMRFKTAINIEKYWGGAGQE